MKYSLAVFDMDGTILNTLEDLKDSVNYALSKHNMPNRTLDEIRGSVGNGILKLIKRSVKEGSGEEEINSVFKTFKSYYKQHCADKTCAYDGIKEALEKIRNMGIKTAVVSNKSDTEVKELCKKYFSGLFDYSVGEKEGKRLKPYPDSVNDVLSYFGVDKENAVYIGDSDVDFNTAKNAGLDVIMVSWGFKDKDFIKALGAKTIINKPNEIIKILS